MRYIVMSISDEKHQKNRQKNKEEEMKKVILTLIVSLATLVVANVTVAQVRLDVSVDIKNRYLVDNAVVPHDDPVVQTDLWFTLPHGFYADLWLSTGLDGKNNGGREANYGAGNRGTFWDVSLFYFDFADLFSKKAFGDVFSARLELFKRFELNESNGITLFARPEYLLATYKPADNSGALIHGGIRHHWSIGENVSVNTYGRLTHDTGLFQADSGWLLDLGSKLSYRVTKAITVHPLNARMVSPIIGINDRDTNWSVGTGITVAFELIS
jgi:hypothetical protein